MAASRRKGVRAELQVVELLQNWWTKLEPESLWRRTPLSGGWSDADARDARDGFNVSGDIMTTAKLFPFCVEVKKRESWSLPALISHPEKSAIMKWWDQAVGAAEDGHAGKPLLLFSKNRQPWRVLWEKQPRAKFKDPPIVEIWDSLVGVGFLEVRLFSEILSLDPVCLINLPKKSS